MKILFDTSIDKARWDNLVHSEKDTTVFSLSAYLDAIADKWCLVVNENYSAGLAVPYIERLGKRIVYTPVFMRYSEWIGESSERDKAFMLIEQQFDAGKLNMRTSTIEAIIHNSMRFQIISPGSWQVNEQVRRMLKRFNRSGMRVERNGRVDEVLQHIDFELSNRIAGINQRSVKRLSKLTKELGEFVQLEAITVYEGSKCVGGIYTLRFNNRTLYLKGSFTEKAKKEGAMYATMNLVIEETLLRNEIFDFGGSNAEGVRRFNTNFGGKDEYYSTIIWNKLPTWYTILERLKKWIKK